MSAVAGKITLREFQEKCLSGQALSEEYSYYIFRTDTNAVLARGVSGFDAAKEKANELRKKFGLSGILCGLRQNEGRSNLASVLTGSPSSMHMVRRVVWITPETSTHQKGRDLADITTRVGTITILTDAYGVIRSKSLPSSSTRRCRFFVDSARRFATR